VVKKALKRLKFLAGVSAALQDSIEKRNIALDMHAPKTSVNALAFFGDCTDLKNADRSAKIM
jgi:hypothetical protein